MDVVLEVFDGLLFDRIYAHLLPIRPSLLPIHPSLSSAHPASTIAAGVKGFADANATLDPATHAAFAPSPWHFEPASAYFAVQPSQYAYMSGWRRDNIYRQLVSLYVVTWIFGLFVYFFFATLSYVFVFDKATFQHPKYLKNQMRMEIRQTMQSIPVMAVFTVPFFLAEVRGYSFIYDSATDPGFSHPLLQSLRGVYNWLQFPLFLLFTDFCIYWIHRGLHHPLVYKRLHKPHHKWIMPTPYASHAFHPLDGYSQSVPYHLFPFIFPLQKFAYIALFSFIQIWTVMIHDGEYVANSPIINGAACHTMHHLYFNYNYGQFTTLWDRLGGSYRQPNEELFRREEKMSAEEWQRQTAEMEKVVAEVEGVDDRSYAPVSDTLAKKVQ